MNTLVVDRSSWKKLTNAPKLLMLFFFFNRFLMGNVLPYSKQRSMSISTEVLIFHVDGKRKQMKATHKELSKHHQAKDWTNIFTVKRELQPIQ